VAPALLRELVVDLSASGSVQAQRSVTVSAEVAARVVELPIEQGDPVERGELLLRLDDRDIRHRIEAARASVSSEQLSLARQDYQRKERLFEDGAVVRSVYEQAKSRYLSLEAAYRSTQATVSGLEEQLAKTRLSAPIAGVVTRIVVAAGEVVAPGSPLLTLENTDRMLVRLELADRDFVKVRLGQPAEATAAAFPGRVFRGEVSRLGSAADPVTRTFEVEARLYNPDRVLRPGLIVTLRIVLGREPGLVVPAEAVVEEHNGRGAVFAVRGGVARHLEVGLGRRLDREVQVTEGLSEGDEVVVVGHQDLVDGQAVEPYREPGGAGTAGS
jgi:membrane fusion protein (multidrug efflux system)